MPIDPQESNSSSLAGERAPKQSSKSLLPLRKEVLNPTPQNTGVGVMLVASAAMFFAVASSAFLLRAQNISSCSRNADVVQRISVDTEHTGLEVLAIEIIDTEDLGKGVVSCGTPEITENPGQATTDIVFRLCPSNQ